MESPLIPLADIKVLLVDDERVSRLLVGNTLRRCGYEVTTAGGGEEAIQQLEKNPAAFSLILSDVMMPGVDGVQLLKYVRGNPLLDDVPVVMVSANEHESTVFECISCGAEDYLLKPVTKKEVQYIWQHVWRRQAANSASAEAKETEVDIGRSKDAQRPLSGGGSPLNPHQLQQPQSRGTQNSGKTSKSQHSARASGAGFPCDSGSSMPFSGRIVMGPPTRQVVDESKSILLENTSLTQRAMGASALGDMDPRVSPAVIGALAERKGLKTFGPLDNPSGSMRRSLQPARLEAFPGTSTTSIKDEFDLKAGVGSEVQLTPQVWLSRQGCSRWPPEVPVAAVPSYVRGMEVRPALSLEERSSGYNSRMPKERLMRQQMVALSWESEEQTPRSPMSLRVPPSVAAKAAHAWNDFTGGLDRDGLWAAEEARQQLAEQHSQRLHPQNCRFGKQWWSPDDERTQPELAGQQWPYPSRSNSGLKSLPSRSHSQHSQPMQCQDIDAGQAQIALDDQKLLLEQTQQMLNLCQEQGEELHRHKLFSHEEAELDDMEEEDRALGGIERGKGSYSVGEGSHEGDRFRDAEERWETEWTERGTSGQFQRQQSYSREVEEATVHASQHRSAGRSRERSESLGEEAGRVGNRSTGLGGRIGTVLSEQMAQRVAGQVLRDEKMLHFDEAGGEYQEGVAPPDCELRGRADAEPSASGRINSPKRWLSESAGGSPSGSGFGKEGRLSDGVGVSVGGKCVSKSVATGSGILLRQWLNRRGRTVDRMECLHIVLQVVRLLTPMHAQGMCSQYVRPSKMLLASGNRVTLVNSRTSMSGDLGIEEKSIKVSHSHGRLAQMGEAPLSAPSSSLGNCRSGEAVSMRGRLLVEGERDHGQLDGGREAGLVERLHEDAVRQRMEGSRNESGSGSMHGDCAGGRNANETRGECVGRQSQDGIGGARSQERAVFRVGTPGQVVTAAGPRIGGGLRRGSGSEGERKSASGWSGSGKGSLRMDEGEIWRRVEAAEQQWYASPEELTVGQVTSASDMYSLGVLFFELLCPPMRLSEWARVMADLRHRILPPTFLSEKPKEAAFCLWLLHPEPSSRPKARDVLSCDLMSEMVKILAEQEAEENLEEEGVETDVLLDFLVEMQCGKETIASRLEEDLQRLTADIDEIHRRRTQMRIGCSGESRPRQLTSNSEVYGDVPLPAPVQVEHVKQLAGKRRRGEEGDVEGQDAVASKRRSSKGYVDGEYCSNGIDEKKRELRSERVMNNFDILEEAYFSMRWKVDARPEGVPRRATVSEHEGRPSGQTSAGKDLHSGHSAASRPSICGEVSRDSSTDWLGCFYDSMCKFARYSKFEVKATLRHGDLLSTSNMVCSLSFDKDEEYFASAGVCKRVKIFSLDTVLSDGVGVHYPVAEMASRSKLSCICWNSYIKSHIASSDYEGHVQLWDASTGQPVVEYEEHEKRTWSVDFSRLDPKHLASGSDDGTVKLWSINQEASVATIKTKANVCCVQFSPHSAHTLAFGSADYKVYTYDWRHTRAPLAVFSGHRKAVSYVKFADANTFVSASTDNTLKLWDLQRGIADCGGGVATSSAACTVTYTGHTNEKNFVGLTLADGYIACGSETNSVYTYHRSLPMPMVSHQFGSTDPVTGTETDDDSGQFVSSVCWRGSTQTLVAANSMGNIKVLEMV